MLPAGIHGHLLEITIVGCSRLRDTEWFSRQDPFVCVEYASTKYRTRTCTDGGKHPTFQEKFTFTLIEGLRELMVAVWNSNTINHDDFIGSGKIQLTKVLTEGYDDSNWPIQSKSGRHAGEIHVIMHYPNAKKMAHASPYSSAPYAPVHSTPPVVHHHTPYAPPSQPYAAPPGYPSYPPSAYPPSAYPPSAHVSHTPYPAHGATPPQHYPPPPHASAYPPPPHVAPYPPPPNHSHSTYPPPPAPYPGTYPPPY